MGNRYGFSRGSLNLGGTVAERVGYMAFPKGLRCDLVPVCAALQVNPLRKDSQKLAKLPLVRPRRRRAPVATIGR